MNAGLGAAGSLALEPGVALAVGEMHESGMEGYTFRRGSNVTTVVPADQTEEEEDIDILDVDEEEEASVKKAMGVGQAVVLPPLPDAITVDVTVDPLPTEMASGFVGDPPASEPPDPDGNPDAGRGPEQASGDQLDVGTNGGQEFCEEPYLLPESQAMAAADENPASGYPQGQGQSNGALVQAEVEGDVGLAELVGMPAGKLGPGSCNGVFPVEDFPGGGEGREAGGEVTYSGLHTRRRRKKQGAGSSPRGEGPPSSTQQTEWPFPTLQGVAKKTRQRSTRPAPVASFIPFVKQQEAAQHRAAQGPGPDSDGGLSPDAHRGRAARPRRGARNGQWSDVDGHGSRGDKLPAAPSGAAPIIQFSIRSIVVPELTVCLSEDATVGTLKQAVADATLAALSTGARLRMLVQGNRVRNDAATLAQIGLSQAGLGPGGVGGGFMTDPDYLSFMMEPAGIVGDPDTPCSPPVDLFDADPAFLLTPVSALSKLQGGTGTRSRGRSREALSPGSSMPAPAATPTILSSTGKSGTTRKRAHSQPPLAAAPASLSPSLLPTRQAAAHAMAAIRAQSQDLVPPPRGGRDGELNVDSSDAEMGYSDPDLGSFGAETAIIVHPSAGQNALSLPGAAGSGALVAIGGRSTSGRALVPHRRSSSSMQMMEHRRRIRRPFSVGEVATLVEAVETLGSRETEVAPLTSAWWREVKEYSFADSRHRTYVDLKDKWKTLVHTAQISPHQRRGEPVPQELLDRVLQAHSLWTEQLRTERDDR